MKELALHLLDLAENSVSAGASVVEISVHEDVPADLIQLEIQDNGRGMDHLTATRAVDPFHTSRTERKIGLGLPLLKAAAEAADGELRLETAPGTGTTIQIHFRRSHIDRMPLGDLSGTFLTLLIAHPEVSWRFNYSAQTAIDAPPKVFYFDDQPIKETLADIELCEPVVLGYLRTLFNDNIQAVRVSLGEPDFRLA